MYEDFWKDFLIGAAMVCAGTLTAMIIMFLISLWVWAK